MHSEIRDRGGAQNKLERIEAGAAGSKPKLCPIYDTLDGRSGTQWAGWKNGRLGRCNRADEQEQTQTPHDHDLHIPILSLSIRVSLELLTFAACVGECHRASQFGMDCLPSMQFDSELYGTDFQYALPIPRNLLGVSRLRMLGS